MKLDYTFHSHTYRCGHATGDIEDYVLKAIEHGYRYYGVSDHVFLKGINSPRVRGDISCLDEYIKKYYESPELQVIELRSEGVICQSITGYENGGDVPFGD